jgi:acyl dehydratase
MNLHAVTHPRGGMYLDDLVVGQLYEHRLRRTLTQMDNLLFSSITLNAQPMHIDRHFCESETEWGSPLMNPALVIGLVIGICGSDLTVGTAIADLGIEDARFPHPLFEGDTVHCTSKVLEKRSPAAYPGLAKFRGDAGIALFHHRAFKQDGKLAAECRREVLVRMRVR